MDLKGLQNNWDTLGKADPFWAILSDPAKKGGKWETEEFFRSGRLAVKNLMEHAASLKKDLPHKKALDFGCGAGRLTQALCEYFENCYGVDIAPSMIDLANKFNRFGYRCRYFVNETEDLRIFEDESFDFVITFLVLQHMKPEFSKSYMREFLRVLSPGGLAVFQVPGELNPNLLITRLKKNPLTGGLINLMINAKKRFNKDIASKIDMYGVPKNEVLRLVEDNGGRILEVRENGWAGMEWVSFTYYVTK